MAYAPFHGDDMIAWLTHFKFSDKISKFFEEQGVCEVVDLFLFNEDATWLSNSGLSKLESTKFCKALQVTTHSRSDHVIEERRKTLGLAGKLGKASAGAHTSVSRDSKSVGENKAASAQENRKAGQAGWRSRRPDTHRMRYSSNPSPASTLPPSSPHPSCPTASSARATGSVASIPGSVRWGDLTAVPPLPCAVLGMMKIPNPPSSVHYDYPGYEGMSRSTSCVSDLLSLDQQVKDTMDQKMVRRRRKQQEQERLERYQQKMTLESISLGKKGVVDLLFCVDKRRSPDTLASLAYLQHGGLKAIVRALSAIHPYVSVRMALVCVDGQGQVRGKGATDSRVAWTCEAAGLLSALSSLKSEMARSSTRLASPPPLSPILDKLADASVDGVGWNARTHLLCYLGASAPSPAASAQEFSEILQRELAAVNVSPLVLVGNESADALVGQVVARIRALLLRVLTVGVKMLEGLYAKIPFVKAAPTPVLSLTERVVCYPLLPLPSPAWGVNTVGRAMADEDKESGMALSPFPLSAPVTLLSTRCPFARTQQQQVVFQGELHVNGDGLGIGSIWGPQWEGGVGLPGLQGEVWGLAGPTARVVLKGFVDTQWSEKRCHEQLLAGHRLGLHMAYKFNEQCSRAHAVTPSSVRLPAPVAFTPICLLQLNERWPQQPFVLCEGEIVGAVEGGLSVYVNNVGVMGGGQPATAEEAGANYKGFDVPDMKMLAEPESDDIDNNPSEDCADHDSVQAFSHFTFVESRGYCVLAGLRGRYVKGQAMVSGGSDGSFVLTTPVVHSRDELSYYTTNLAADGIDMVMRAHKCNGTCRLLRLPEYVSGSESVPLSRPKRVLSSSLAAVVGVEAIGIAAASEEETRTGDGMTASASVLSTGGRTAPTFRHDNQASERMAVTDFQEAGRMKHCENVDSQMDSNSIAVERLPTTTATEILDPLELLRKAAEQRDRVAQYELGRLYFYGHVVGKDLHKAEILFNMAAQGGHTAASGYHKRCCEQLGVVFSNVESETSGENSGSVEDEEFVLFAFTSTEVIFVSEEYSNFLASDDDACALNQPFGKVGRGQDCDSGKCI
eukprot:gene28111-33943_t